MRQIAGIAVDSLAFAREGRHLIGELAVNELPRLADALADDDAGALACDVSGGRNEAGKLYLRLMITGELRLRCQRCLEAMSFPLAIDSRVLLVPPGAPWPDETLEDDSADAIDALDQQSVAELVEEELLLALPVAPRHDACGLPGGERNDGAASPFAVLAKLK
ncbi:MAG TPA: YceD family protein [Rhodocyclaceae bacterium]|nr:YceD family protein [Rhodocyclaceae bacterium]